jgi:hypothetical protein
MRKRLTIVAGVVAVLSLIGGMFFLQAAKADDLLRTNVGYREVHIVKNGNSAVGEIRVKLYASQFDADGDGDTKTDSQRAVGRGYKIRGAYRIQLNTVRLQRLTDTGWETLKSTAPKNSGPASSVVAYTAPPTHFECDSGDIFRVQVIGLVRWGSAGGQLNSFNEVSHRWINTDAGSTCEPLEV